MTKIGKQSLRFLFFLIVLPFVLLANSSYAQDFTVQSTVSENRIFSGEQFTLQIEITGSTMSDVSLPEPPEIPSTRLLSSTPSRSTSISIVNGRTTTSITYSYSYVARSNGNFTIPAVTVTIGDEEYKTEPIDIEILDRGQITQDGSRQMPDIFLELDLNTETPVIGEQIVASIILYFKQGIEVSSFQPASGWRTDGFWKEELENIRQPQAESTILNGVRYRKAALMRYALFPTRSGELSLSEFSMNVGVRKGPSRNDPFGSFFGGSVNQRRVSLESEPVEIEIEPLPELESDAVNINAVGDLEIERTLNRNEVETGETVELTTTIRGTGNIPLLRKPEYNLPDGIDLYTPQESSDVERRGLNIRGEKSFTELLVPRAPDEYTVPEQRISVYDAESERHRYITLPELTFRASPGSGTDVASADELSRDRLRPITGLTVWNTKRSVPFHKTLTFWILWMIPFLVLIIGYLKKRQIDKLQTDSNYSRSFTSFETAKARLEAARTAHNSRDTKELYNQLHKALSGFVSDKLGLPLAGLSDRDIVDNVKEKGADPAIVKSLKGMLDKCATISYAPAGSMSEQMNDIEKTETLIKDLKKVL